MARQTGLITFTGSIGPITGFQMNGEHFVKTRGSISKHRFRKGAEFEKTRRNAFFFARAVDLARIAYYQIPVLQRDQKKVWYPLRNRAQELLRKGMEEKAVLEMIQKEYGKGLEGLPKTTKDTGLDLAGTMKEILPGQDYRQLDRQITEQLELVNNLYEKILQQKEKARPQGKCRKRPKQNPGRAFPSSQKLKAAKN